MEIDRKALKEQAKDALELARPRGWTVALLYIFMTTGVSVLLSLIPLPVDPETGLSSPALFLNILYSMYGTVVGFGLVLWALWVGRRLSAGASALTQGFSVAGRVIVMNVLIFLRVVGWTALFYLGYLILLSSALMLFPLLSPGAAALLLLLSYGVFFGFYVSVILRYALAPYLLADHPDDGPSAAIRRSVSLMWGWKWELFKLDLSFLNWQIPISLLSLAGLAACLWYFDFFLLPLPATLEEAMTTGVYFAAVSSHPLTVLVITLIPLPLSLKFLPYREVTLAGFYDARLQAPSGPDLPMMPPV